jgi:acetyl esterase/lipase
MPLKSIVVSAFLSLALIACSPISLINAVSPAETSASQLAKKVPYGRLDRQRLDVYVPKDGGSHPVLFFISGGGWSEGEKESYSFVGEAFAAKGFVTVIADYRLVPEVRFPAFIEDGALALKWVEDNIGRYGGDLNRLYVAGHSAGAYNGAMLVLDPHYLRAVGFKTPIRAYAGLSGPFDFYPFDVAASINAFGNARDPLATQPVNLVTKAAPPMVLLSGTADSIVDVKNTKALAAKATEKGVEVETHYYAGQEHVDPLIALGPVFRSKNSALEDILGFFARHGSGV